MAKDKLMPTMALRAGLLEQTPHAGNDTERWFISDVYQTAVSKNLHGDLTLPEFKELLIQLWRKGKIRLTRSDLVRAFDPRKVHDSTIEFSPVKGGQVTEFQFIAKNPFRLIRKKRRRNPFNLALPRLPAPVGAGVGAAGAVAVDAVFRRVMPEPWHPWAHLGMGALACLPRSGPCVAGFAGASFYAGISGLYYRHIQQTILQTMGATLAST